MTRRASSLPTLLLALLAGACGSDRAAFTRVVASTQEVESELARVAQEAAAGHPDPALAPLLAAVPAGSSRDVSIELRDLRFDGDAPRSLRAFAEVRASAGEGTALSRAEISGDVSRRGDGTALALHAPESVAATSRARPAYRDVTVASGVADVHHAPPIQAQNHLVRGIWPGSGAGAADVDGDGDVDLLVLDGERSILYENDGDARFTDATDRRRLSGLAGTGCAFADFDGDGDPDLLVTDVFADNRLFENASGAFVDRTAASGTTGCRKASSVAVADYDGDGLLDAYVCSSGDYYSFLPDPVWNARNGYPNHLLRNLGGLRFADAAPGAAVDSRGWSLAASFADYDGDGDQDLYVANDFGLNQLFRNEGDGTFRETTRTSGTGDRGYGMSVTWGDADEDGREDLYVSNIESRYAFLLDDKNFPLPILGKLFRFRVVPMMRTMLSGNSLFRNRGDGTFEDVTRARDVWRGGWSWGALFVDYDLDGALDLFSPNGFVTQEGVRGGEDGELAFWIDSSERWSQYLKGKAVFDMEGRSLHGHQRDALFHNPGPAAGRAAPFEEVGFVEGAGVPGDARGAVRADFDGDGRPDLYVRQVTQRGALLLHGKDSGGRIALDVLDRNGSPAIGARATVHCGARSLVRVVRTGEGYFASQDPTILVGLGSAPGCDRIEIAWPSGARAELPAVAEGKRVVVREGNPAPVVENLKP
ncbi:MAG: CRTAC1 family protein [Acidobacteriota bacterium]